MSCILIIDDEPLVRQTIRLALEPLGHSIIEARDGFDGATKALRCDPALIITDILMPDRDGIEAIVELKRSHPTIAILAMSGGGRTRKEEFLEIARHVGADDVLRKPFDVTVLVKKIESLLSAP